MSGTSVGASGDMADDMRDSGYTVRSSPPGAQLRAGSGDPWPPAFVVADGGDHHARTRLHGVWVPAFAGTTGWDLAYFFEGAILASAGLASAGLESEDLASSGLASGFVAASLGWSIRSTFAASRS